MFLFTLENGKVQVVMGELAEILLDIHVRKKDEVVIYLCRDFSFLVLSVLARFACS